MKGAAALLWTAVFAATQARALPYCIAVTGIPDQCIYADAAECQTQAIRQGGVCKVNTAVAIPNQTGSGQFCLVVSGQASVCLYSDRTSCENDAIRRHAACVQAGSPNQVDIDPFAIRRPY